MNDWRSTFDGANDHEADWEQAFVILEELPDGDVEPVWFAAAAHDEQGADLRRRWDDPKLHTRAMFYARELVLLGLGALGLFILIDNARELVRR